MRLMLGKIPPIGRKRPTRPLRENCGADRSPPLRGESALERAQFVGCADKKRVDGADPTAHLRRRGQLHQRAAHHDADRVRRAGNGESHQRDPHAARESKDHRRHTKHAHRGKQAPPAWWRKGKRAISSDMVTAPAAGAARSIPNPTGPARRISCAKMGISATAPPSSITNKSSEMAPSSMGERLTYWKPARITFTEVARCSMRPGRVSKLATSTGTRAA